MIVRVAAPFRASNAPRRRFLPRSRSPPWRIIPTSLPIAAVAAACGFYDHSAFVKRFRRHTGLAPLAYRKSRHAILSGKLAHLIRAERENLSAE